MLAAGHDRLMVGSRLQGLSLLLQSPPLKNLEKVLMLMKFKVGPYNVLSVGSSDSKMLNAIDK